MVRIGVFILLLAAAIALPAAAADLFSPGQPDYERYRMRMESVQTVEDIALNGFVVFEDNIFRTSELIYLGRVDIIPAIDPKHGRIILFFAREDGAVVYKTDDLECNNQRRGELNQPNLDVAGYGLRDMNGDGLTDIVMISRSVCPDGPYAGVVYTVGDALFQSEAGFYRDWRLSDRINRFGMNIDVNTVIAFVRDGISAEFLYLAGTVDELIQNGFEMMHERAAYFETFGDVRLFYGTYRMSGYYILMVYLADSDGNLLWNFQPMGKYTNFSNMRNFMLTDIDGDGRTDIVFLIRYGALTLDWKTVRVTDYVIYYQRSGYFERDWEFSSTYLLTGNDTVPDIAEKAAAFWRGK